MFENPQRITLGDHGIPYGICRIPICYSLLKIKELQTLIHTYQKEITCEYRKEVYRVRDNGAVFRCSRPNKRVRPLDNKWTFGSPNKRTGYMNIASETVHRIVATAFHGIQPTDKHIVDHIDTNRRNNRPKNLRWITKLENLILNPITLQRITFSYGSLDNFFENPSNSIHKNKNPNFDWMRTVTKQESENTLRNLRNWSDMGTIPKGGQLEEWIFRSQSEKEQDYTQKHLIVESLTPTAKQKNWKTPCKFPNCPLTVTAKGIKDYKNSLKLGSIFSENQFGSSSVIKCDILQESNQLYVLTKGKNIKPFALAKVYVDNECYIHESISSYFKIDGAEQGYVQAIGGIWEGGEIFDELVG